MSDIVRCKWLGKVIALSEERWRDSIVPLRPELADHLEAIHKTVERPLFVTEDADDPQWQFHYRHGILPPPHEGLYLRVEVRYQRRKLLRSMTGVVYGAQIVKSRFKREREIWSAM